jgi:nucleoside 2-deoxyribosyltransferase
MWSYNLAATDRHASVGEVRYSLLQSGKRRAHTSVHTRLQQVDVWTAQLIAEEERAKQNSAYLLFVIDPTTVNAATFVEIPYLIAQGKKLVIVFLNQDAWLCNGHKW